MWILFLLGKREVNFFKFKINFLFFQKIEAKSETVKFMTLEDTV